LAAVAESRSAAAAASAAVFVVVAAAVGGGISRAVFFDRSFAARVLRVIGEVRDQPCVIIDDMISTGGTISRSIAALLEAGARPEIYVVATHGLFLPGAREKLSHDSVRKVLVTDTIPVVEPWPGLIIVSVAPLIASAIDRLARGQSFGDLFG
jgi:ribose-phosphate pyrophosphokinase